MAGHTGNGVIQNHDGVGAFIVDDVYQSGDAGVDKGRVADDGDEFFIKLLAAGFRHAQSIADRGAHADGAVQSS